MAGQIMSAIGQSPALPLGGPALRDPRLAEALRADPAA
jgi:hypothetical protein